MYSFHPIADSVPGNVIFFVIALHSVGILCMGVLFGVFPLTKKSVGIVAAILAISYGLCYHVIDTAPAVNQPVVGKFVGYQLEGYNERSGKTRADRHYVYVIYEVDGHQILMVGAPGVAYPREAILYKN